MAGRRALPLPPPAKRAGLWLLALDFGLDVLYWRLATASARNPRCAWRHSERARLYHVLHLRHLSKKNEGIHSVVDAMAAAARRDAFAAALWAGQRTQDRSAVLGGCTPAHLLQSFWLLSEHRACAATLSVNEISPELEAAMLVSGTSNADCSRRS